MQRSSEKGRSAKRRFIIAGFLIAGFQSALVIILVFALADPRLLSHSDQVNVFFCLDVSESISGDQLEKAEKSMKKAKKA
jgi:hypothetical protein